MSIELGARLFEIETPYTIVDDLSYYDVTLISDFPADPNQNDSQCEDITSTNELAILNPRRVVGVELPLPTNKFCGTPLDRFLTAFSKRATPLCSFSLGIDLIQNGVNTLSTASFEMQTNVASRKNKPETLLGLGYLLAAIAQGSMIEGFCHKGMIDKYIEQMRSAIKTCVGNDSMNGVVVNLVLAFTCILAGRENLYVRHIGFAKAILRSWEVDFFQLPINLRKTYQALALLKQTEPVFVKIEMLKFSLLEASIEINSFQKSFPFFSTYLKREELSNAGAFANLDPDDCADLHNLFTGGKFLCLHRLLMMPSKYFREQLVRVDIERAEKSMALLELTNFLNFVLSSYECPFEYVIPCIRAFFRVVEAFQLLFDYKTEEARIVLKILLEDLSTFDFCIACLDPEGEHGYHAITAALSVLQMPNEYDDLQKKINTVLKIRESKSLFHDCLPLPEHRMLNCICEDSSCLQLWQCLPELLSVDKHV